MKQLLSITLTVYALSITGPMVAQEKKPSPPKVDMSNYVAPVKLADFLERNPGVKTVEWKTGSKIFLKFKNGNSETYDLTNQERRKLFRNKYGAVPRIPGK